MPKPIPRKARRLPRDRSSYPGDHLPDDTCNSYSPQMCLLRSVLPVDRSVSGYSAPPPVGEKFKKLRFWMIANSEHVLERSVGL